ncbi:hypothetical protein [Okeania sp. SIO2B3]|uniref:hypothetical protein n=1 Tax=Okeania sp. SIO2B3 TaxID=2607784 RepID=UPI0013C06BB0|nr:hypothetical protein [Okeania sp. SIO2B3]NET43183.1 hypothetical protein [Okeania sp. SIO2B3]
MLKKSDGDDRQQLRKATAVRPRDDDSRKGTRTKRGNSLDYLLRPYFLIVREKY